MKWFLVSLSLMLMAAAAMRANHRPSRVNLSRHARKSHQPRHGTHAAQQSRTQSYAPAEHDRPQSHHRPAAPPRPPPPRPIAVTSTIVRFIDTRPTIAARCPRTITHPPTRAFVLDNSRRSPSAYPTGSSASRIGRSARKARVVPNRIPRLQISRSPITRVFQVITGCKPRPHLRPHTSQRPPPQSADNTHKAQSRPHHRPRSALAASSRSHGSDPASDPLRYRSSTNSPHAPSAAAARPRQSPQSPPQTVFLCASVCADPATSADAKCVITPSSTQSRLPLQPVKHVRNPSPGATPCRAMPVSISRWTGNGAASPPAAPPQPPTTPSGAAPTPPASVHATQ